MIRAFYQNKKWVLWAYGGLFLLLVGLYMQVKLDTLFNEWYKDFYNIVQHVDKHTLKDFWHSMWRFLQIAIPYILLATAISYFSSLYAFKWREAITFDYLPLWREVNHEIEGSSQRIQEDIYRLARMIESIGIQVVRAIMTLIAFLPILWGLSQNITVPYMPQEGSLVWVALIVSIGGVAISWIVGIKLPGIEYNNQKVEAAFRKELVYAEDDKDQYGHIPTMIELFSGLKSNYLRLFNHTGYFNIWLNTFNQLLAIVPYMIVGPSLFTGAVTLGVLIQVADAFSRVRQSFSVFIDNWVAITDLRSIHKRLREFEHNIGYGKR